MGTITVGCIYGRWTVLKIEGFKPNGKKRMSACLCQCSCGTQRTVTIRDIVSGRSLSCGCLQKEIAAQGRYTHGYSRTDLYRVWASMKSRCSNTSNERYGGRGITVCGEWHEFNNFMQWASYSGYKKGLTLDRVDNNGNYCPENCKWITNPENAQKTSRTIYIEFEEETKTLRQWSLDARCNVSYSGLKRRIEDGWSMESALKTPPVPRSLRRWN